LINKCLDIKIFDHYFIFAFRRKF